MENLRQLMAAYFHQDWYDEYHGSWQSAVDDFVRREPARAGSVCDEIAQLIGEAPDEAALRSSLASLGNYYWPGDGPRSYRDWLLAILDRITVSGST